MSRAEYMRQWRAKKKAEQIAQAIGIWTPILAETDNLLRGTDLPRARRFLRILCESTPFTRVGHAQNS